MCGIAGYVSQGSAPGILPKMLNRIAHRGPDGEGQWAETSEGWHIFLGHRRLSIIDLATGGQPMAAGGAHITFNGEIYNYRELRAGMNGVSFRTESDTEVLLHTLLEKGVEPGLRALNGMFALALWEENTLLLARDRAGIKPLYYAQLSDGGIAFASELSALLAHTDISPKIDSEALAEYFFLDYAQAPNSLIRDVKKLEPGHYLTWQNGKLAEPRAYWQLETKNIAGSDKALSAELWERLGLAVRRQLVADVPVGILLSGGLDSSAIAALAASERKGIETFSIGFSDADYDESAFARLVAKELNTVHHEQIFGEEELLSGIDSIVGGLDEPIADPSILPTSMLADLASRRVKVALGGDGGDELWAGYPTYRAHNFAKIYGSLPGLLKQSVIPWAAEKLPVQNGYQRFDWKVKRFASRWHDNPALRHLRWMSSVDLPELSRVSGLPGFKVDFLNRLKNASPPSLNDALALDFKTYLPGSVLAKVDRASMAHGLEVRPPFLDVELVDWAFSLHSSLKLRHGTSKYLLKAAAAAHLPEAVVQRRKKGFGIPLAHWLRGPLAPRLNGLLNDSPLWDFLRRETFIQWREEHMAMRKDRSKPLWALIVLDAWVKRFGIES